MTKLNQRINIYASYQDRSGDTANSKEETFTVRATVLGAQSNDLNYTVVSASASKKQVTCSSRSTYCDSVVIMNVPYIDYDSYQFNITTDDALSKGYLLVKYYFAVHNASYTLFELWFRFFFLVTTVIVIILYAIKLRGFEWKDWAIEQRWVACLLFGLLGYNNPLFPLTVLLDGAFWPFLDQMLLVSFLVLLMFFWIIMFDGIRTEPALQTFRTFYLPKFIMLALFWIAAVVIFTWIELNQIRNPGQDVYSQAGFLVFYVIMIILLVIYLFWLSYVVFRAISSRNTMPYLSLRIKFFGAFTLLVLLVVIGGVIFGVVGPISNNAAAFLSFVSLLNLYVYTLSFVYFPSKDVIGRAKNSGMVTLQDLDESTTGAEMDERPVHPDHHHRQAAPAPASSFQAPNSSTPAHNTWRNTGNESSHAAPAPIKINFDGLDEDDEESHL